MRKLSKRIFDLLLTLPTIVILLPAFVVIWAAIKFSGGGAVVFSQQRTGKHAKPFTFYKFRTMRTDADPFGASSKSGDDSRLTKIGKFMLER